MLLTGALFSGTRALPEIVSMIRGRVTQVLVFAASVITLLEYLEVFNEKEIAMQATADRSLVLRLLLNPLYAGKMNTFTFFILYFTAVSFSRIERNVFGGRPEALVLYLLANFVFTDLVSFAFRVDFGMKFFLLGSVYMAKKVSPYAYFKVFVVPVSFQCSFLLFSLGVLSQGFARLVVPYLLTLLGNDLFVFWDQVPRLMTFSWLQRRDSVQRVVHKRPGFEDRVDSDWLAEEYLDRLSAGLLQRPKRSPHQRPRALPLRSPTGKPCLRTGAGTTPAFSWRHRSAKASLTERRPTKSSASASPRSR